MVAVAAVEGGRSLPAELTDPTWDVADTARRQQKNTDHSSDST